MITYKWAADKDISNIIELCRTFHKESDRSDLLFIDRKIRTVIANVIREGIALLAEDNGQLVGMMGAMLQKDFFFDEISAGDYVVYVKPEYRGKGIGGYFIDNYILWAKEQKIKHICLGVNSGINTKKTVRFYQNKGFKVTGIDMRLEE